MLPKKYLGFDKNFDIKIISQPKNKTKKQSNFTLVNAGSVGYYIITPLVVGVFLGYTIDKKIGTNFLVVLGIFLGAIGAFYNLFRLTK